MSRDSGDVRVTRDGATIVLTIDYVKRRNALGMNVRTRMIEEMALAQADASARAVIITGAEGCFCSGGDISSMDGITGMAGRARLANLHALARSMANGPKPVIAAVEGYAFGAGMSLAAMCDLVVTARDAKWNCSFARIGLMPDFGALWAVPRRIGVGKAKRLMMTAETIDGPTAYDWGLAEYITDSGDALHHAKGVAAQIAPLGPNAMAMMKAHYARNPENLDEALNAEADGQAVLFTTEDFKEGVDAFMTKRKADFRGR